MGNKETEKNKKNLNKFMRDHGVTNVLLSKITGIKPNSISHYRTDRPDAMPEGFVARCQIEYLHYLEQVVKSLKDKIGIL
jgi:hypothetical protein